VADGVERTTLMDTADAIYMPEGVHNDSYTTMITANNTVESEIADFVALTYRADTAMDTDTLAALNVEADTNLTSVQNYAAAVNTQNDLLNEAFKDDGGAINNMFDRVITATNEFNASDIDLDEPGPNHARANQWNMTATEAADEKLIVGTYYYDGTNIIFNFKDTDIDALFGTDGTPHSIQLPTGVIYTLADTGITDDIATYTGTLTMDGDVVPPTTTITGGLISASPIPPDSLNRFNNSIELTERMLGMLRTKVEDVWTANNTGASAFETPTDIREAITAAETYLTSIKSDVREQTVDLMGYRDVMTTALGVIQTQSDATTGYVGGEIVGRDSIVSFYSNKVAYSNLTASLDITHSTGTASVNASIDDVLGKITARMVGGTNWASSVAGGSMEAFF
jgi:hypothetical protein